MPGVAAGLNGVTMRYFGTGRLSSAASAGTAAAVARNVRRSTRG